MANYATGAQRRLLYIQETEFGTTPATPAMTILRNTSDSLNLSKDTLESEELDGSRAIRFSRHGNERVAGDIEAELAFADFDDFIAAAMCNDWVVDDVDTTLYTLVQGADWKTFSIEKGFLDIDQYIMYKGCGVNTMNFSIAPNSLISTSMNFLGSGVDTPTVVTGADSVVDPANNEPFDSFTGTLSEGGATIATVTSLEFTIDNTAEANYVLMNPEAVNQTIGRSRVSGTITVYVEDMSLFNKFLNETESSIEVTLTDPDGNAVEFLFPKVKYNGAELSVSDDRVIEMPLPFIALHDTVEGTNLKITKDAIA